MDSVPTKRRLVAFLYELMRDHITPGKVEKLVMDVERDGITCYQLSNEHIAKYAKELADRLERELLC